MLIWLASYPRSGNTFLRVVLKHIFGRDSYSLYNDPGDIAADAATSNVVGHARLPDDFDIQRARDDDAQYFIKTHEYPVNDEDRAIYVVRDGRESVLSYLRYEKTHRKATTTLRDVIYGSVPFGSWSRHLEKWDPVHRKNTLLLRFEELVETPGDLIDQIASFVGIAPVGTEVPSFAELNRVNPRFFASGKKQSWRKAFSDDEQLAFLLRHYSAMVKYGYIDALQSSFGKSEDAVLFAQISQEIEYLQNTVLMNVRHELVGKIDTLRNLMFGAGYEAAPGGEVGRTLSEQTSLIRELNEKVGEQGARIESLNKKLYEMQSEHERARRELAEKEARIGAVTDQFAKARQQVAAEQEARIGAVTDQFAKARQQVAAEQLEQQALRARMEALQNELAVAQSSSKQLLDDVQLIRNSWRFRLGDMIVQPYASVRRKLFK